MENFDFDTVKAEKAKAMLRYRRLQTVANFFRVIELCFVVLLLSWISTRLPSAVKLSGDYLRQIPAVIATPTLAFLLTNVIILTLISSSGRILGGGDAETELYEEVVKRSETEHRSMSNETEEIMYEDKQIICEANKKEIKVNSTYEGERVEKSITTPDTGLRRSQSVNLKTGYLEEKFARGMLRRSNTEVCDEEPVAESELDDEMSNEEFQRVVEAFIAKQSKFHRQEFVSVALQKQS